MTECKSCQLVSRRDIGEAPFWDNIVRTKYWDVVHNFQTTLPGWLVLVNRRHIAALDELSEAEADELGPLIRQASIALKAVVGCSKTYVIQFAELPEFSHVHFHIIPRMADMPAEFKGPKVFNYKPKSEAERVNDERMNEIERQIKPYIKLGLSDDQP